MNGSQLFFYYLETDPEYARTLRTARLVVGNEVLFDALEKAENAGQHIELVGPPEWCYGEPYDIRLVEGRIDIRHTN